MAFPRILVLGATGRIGRILQGCWPAERAIWQARPAPGRTAGVGWRLADPLADPAWAADLAGEVGAVLGLAGVTPTTPRPEARMAENIDLGLAAVRLAAGLGVPALLASSAAVYGAGPGPLAETTPPAPVSAYGRAKAEMETRAAALAAALGVPVTALRIGNIAGADAILGGWRPGFALDRFADGRTPRRSYIGSQSLAAVLAQLAGRADLPGVLNIAAPGTVEMGALLDMAGLAWTPRPAPASAIAEVALDVTRLCALVPLPPADAESLVAEWRGLPQSAGK
ncbi:NAD-dependent epimerase/dehydratase family protein [Pseudodonghicola flavimaris]|uniref:NAD(P)-dependent oxidoreductase n=1 Tax=Pseudodonghicola flavimaris TaxID=3050036 RepID=A0ABT7F847_9RHOB|nr:NAD(P)-dependent oxidoreductase [Pseudodonghicola flavimaris]MDK3020787.1 NAD(P)-dependent oxidoreductase [Pseudodonghicola flavimaris]